jgi:hypothetical protein
MTEQVLTDAEMRRLFLAEQGLYNDTHEGAAIPFARAVEAAVLAKRPKPIYELHPADATPHVKKVLEDAGYVVVLRTTACREAVPEAYGCVAPGTVLVPEAECRERERKAWDIGADWGLCYSSTDVASARALPRWKERESRYPSLRPQTPPPLTLSTGTWTRRPDGIWTRPDAIGTRCADDPNIKTAADADALAAWLRQYGER